MDIIDSTETRGPECILVHGIEGIGKSTWAKGAPKPLFADVEHGLAELGVPCVCIDTFAKAEEFVKTFPADQYRTAVIDTADALDLLMQRALCEKMGWKSIEDPGYSKGWTRLREQWVRFLASLRELQARNVEIIMLAHSQIKNFGNPAGADYARYTPKINDKVTDLIKGWSSVVLFAIHEETVQGAKDIAKDRGKGVGTGRRIVHTQREPAHDAKNRLNLPPILPLTYAAFDAGRKAFWEKKGSPDADTPSVTPTSTPGSTGTPPPPQPVPPTTHEVGLALGEAQKLLGITSVAETKSRFMEPLGVKMLKDATPEQLVRIVALLITTYETTNTPLGSHLQAARTKAEAIA